MQIKLQYTPPIGLRHSIIFVFESKAPSVIVIDYVYGGGGNANTTSGYCNFTQIVHCSSIAQIDRESLGN